MKSETDVPVFEVFVDENRRVDSMLPGDTPLGSIPILVQDALDRRGISWRRARARHTLTKVEILFPRYRS